MPSSSLSKSVSRPEGLPRIESRERINSLKKTRSVKGMLPVADEPAYSTRGQFLPLILSQLGTSLGHHGQSKVAVTRKGSFYIGPDDGDQDFDHTTAFQRVKPSREVRPSLITSLSTDGSNWSNGVDQGHLRDPENRRSSEGFALLNAPQIRSMRLIGNSNPRYRWEQYWKADEELGEIKNKSLRKYYQRNNDLIQQYVFIDKLLDSSLPHNLLNDYFSPLDNQIDIPKTINEETNTGNTPPRSITALTTNASSSLVSIDQPIQQKKKRNPKDIYRIHDELSPLLREQLEATDIERDASYSSMPEWSPEEETDIDDPVVKVAIFVNFAANIILLILKVIVTLMTNSVSVLAALVDAILDFLSTAIVWLTTRLITTRDDYHYPIGRRKLEPIGVLVFSVIMIVAFFQVLLQGFNKLTSGDQTVIALGIPAIAIMATTVIVKGLCWMWCRLVKNSGVQALAQDAETDVFFNTFSIIFPLIGYYANIWWLDPLGGCLLSIYVISAWSRTSITHIRNLSGRAASADERNILLYLTMRFAKTIKYIQSLQAYHSGDKINVEVDIVLDENISLRDAHDLGESLQYVLESVPTVERSWVHLDYSAENLPSHMEQQFHGAK